MFQVSVDNGLAESGGVANVGHSRPFFISDRIEASNLLSSWIVHEELERTRDICLAFLLGNLDLFVGLGNRAITTAVLENFLGRTEEARMSVEIDLALLGLVPFGVQKKILGVQQAIDSGGLVFRAIWNCHLKRISELVLHRRIVYGDR